MTLQRRCSDPVNMGSASSDPNTNKHAAIRSHEDRVQGGGLRTTKNKHSRLGQASFIVLSSQMILSCRLVTMEPGAGHRYLSLLKRRSFYRHPSVGSKVARSRLCSLKSHKPKFSSCLHDFLIE